MSCGDCHGRKNSHIKLCDHEESVRSAVSKMEIEISMRSENGGIKDADLVSSGDNRLGSSETRFVSTRRIHLLWENSCIIFHCGRLFKHREWWGPASMATGNCRILNVAQICRFLTSK